jgi:PAS domain S-box-containing protein
MIISFIQNAAMLITLSVFYGVIKWYKPKKEIYYQLIQGLWFGAVAVAAMMMPFEYSGGAFYDGRSVVITLAGLWSGGISVFISVLIAGAFRAYLGGAGIWAGIATIVFCGITGLMFRQLFNNKLDKLRIFHFFGIGIIAHLVMLACQFLLPESERLQVIEKIWLPVLAIFPLTFAFIAKLFQIIHRYIKSEQLVREAETLYRTTLQSIGDAVISTDIKGRINQMNPVAEQLTGWKFVDAKGKMLDKIFRIINEESREKVESPFVKVIGSGAIVGLANHTLLISKTGQEIPIADSGAPVKNEQGEIAGVVLVFRDQTDEREYQKRIAQSEAKYRELVESTDAIAWEYDVEQDKWTYVAPQVTEKTGWLPEEWTNLEFWKNNLHPDERESAANYCFACAAKGEPHALEYRYKTKDGNYIWLRDVVSVEMQEDKPVKLRGVMFDITERKQAETLLMEREFWLRESQRVGKIGSYDFDITNDHWSSSEVLDEIFGITTENPHTLESWNAIIHPEQQQEMLDYFLNSVVKERNPFEKEYKIIRQNDGAERWVLGHGELTYNDSGEPIRMYGTIQDITERKIYEKELSESEERFRKAVLLAPIPIMVHDEDGKVINVSEGWTHFSGYSMEEIPTLKQWAQKAYGEKAKEVENYVNELFIEEKTIYSGEFEVISKTGEKRIWNFYTTPLGKLSSGKKIMLSMAPDVTERKRVQSELIIAKEKAEESERAYRQLFENHTAVKFLIDPNNGGIVKANQAAADFYGWGIEKLQSMKIGEINILPPEKINEALKYASTNRRVYFEFKHRLFNGQVRDVEVFSSKIEYGGKELLHSIVHDVTEKKKLFDDLIVAKEKAEESERLKSAFLANMSHEIRTPLNGILGFTNLLCEDGNLSVENKKEYGVIINKSAEGLLKIINDILDISRLETGKTVIEQKPFEAEKVLSVVYSIFNKKMADTGKNQVELKLEKQGTQIILNTDENRLIQIFSNLIDNALRFTSKGSVTFGISEMKENKVEFFVADTGVGIPKEKHGVIFDRFSQADNSSTRSYGGTGLGLAIVKKLLELMGSEITLESEPGKGACFRFQLPYISLNKNEEKVSDEKPEGFVKINKTKILVVEDDSVSRLYFRQILNHHSGELFFAETGKEALHLFETQNPDVILMDLGLPDMNGLEVVRKIRETDNNVFIIAQTAYAMAEDKQKAIEAGCNDFVAKPVKSAVLMKKLMQFNN